MKYLTLIYYDTFARFFSAIEDEVKKTEPSAEFLHMAIFPSGYLYMRAHGRKTKLLAHEVRKPSVSNTKVPEVDREKIVKYHAVAGARHGEKYLFALNKRAQAYVNYWEKIVESYDPDVVIFSGDTRIAAESLQHYLDTAKHRAKRYFFEQGPNGTTIFDTKGVNANCSFREEASSLTGIGYTPEPANKSEKFKRNPVFRGIDYAVIAMLRPLGKLPPEWDSMSLGQYPKSKYIKCVRHGLNNTTKSAREILVALQVPDDANNIHHNPLNLGDTALLNIVLEATKNTKLPIRIREHPLYRRRYTAELYEQLSFSDRALLSDATLDEDLAKAEIVVTVNSMTGLDAYLKNVPAVILGNAFYDHLPGIQRADAQSVGGIISKLLSNNLVINKKLQPPASIFAEMRARHFISGHYLNADLAVPASAIAKIITSNNNHGKVPH
jgi:capsular polysaccharide export protein